MATAKKLAWLVGIVAILLMCLTAYSSLGDNLERFSSPWNGPVFQDGQWQLEGITKGRLQRAHLFEQELDLVEIRYGGGSLWALVGVKDSKGSYEPLVEGMLTEEQVREGFSQPRYVTLTIPGTPKAVDHGDCSTNQSMRCMVVRLVEGSRPPIVLDPDEEPTGDLSNVFIHSGVFPAHYAYGFLTWAVHPGKVIEQGLEGG